MTDCYRIPSLENVYLEDSFLLDVEETDKEIIMRVEVVLTENHAFYEKPLPDEAYCYREAKTGRQGDRETTAY